MYFIYDQKRAWQDRARYLSKLKKMKAKEIQREIRDMKYALEPKTWGEHKMVAEKSLAAYKLSAIIQYLRGLL